MSRRPLWGWAQLLTPEQRRVYCGRCRGAGVPQPVRRIRPAVIRPYFDGFNSVAVAARWRRLPVSVIRRAIDQGSLRAVKIRGRWRITIPDFDRWQDANVCDTPRGPKRRVA